MAGQVNHPKGTIIVPYPDAKDNKAVVTGERCWQCRCKSVVRYNNRLGGVGESCLNDCGPRKLCELLRF